MNAFVIDDEPLCLEDIVWQLSRYSDIELKGSYGDPLEASEAICALRPDVVFLDIDMPKMNGFELAQEIQAQSTGTIVIFVTAYKKYALEAYNAYPLDFLVKPVSKTRLDETIEHLRRQYRLLHPTIEKQSGFRIKCFGSFEIITDSDARFPTRRVKELLLYLISRRGVAATREEMLDALFDRSNDRNSVNNLYVTLSRLRVLLNCWDGGQSRIRLTSDNALLIAPGVCDYIDFITFARQHASISRESAGDAARLLKECAAPFLVNEPYEWCVDNGEEVETEYERIALELGDCYIAENRLEEAASVLTALLARNPLSTDGYASLLRIFMKTGDRASFATRYREYARMLKNEFSLKPEAVFRDFYATLKQ
ncbi:MAG: response regulator [Eubacteriales bacterium]|nr:response regulator [Eubacteriales bacterium]